MPRKVQEYSNDAITVWFEPALCVHTANCLRGNNAVFDVGRRKWIEVDAGTADDIARVIETCPSGALRYERHDGGPQELPAEHVTVRAATDGPLVVRGSIDVTDDAGTVIRRMMGTTLCRCGQSANKPFCDNTHRTIGFRAPSIAEPADAPVTPPEL